MSLRPDPDGVFRERRECAAQAPVTVAWSCVADLGGEPGWYAVDAVWRLRGVVDRVLGGAGNRGRPARELRVGDAVDGWRVEAVEAGRSLTLVSEYRMPGLARMTHEVLPVPAPDGRPGSARSRLVQRLDFHPCGAAGRLFWWAELPAHKVVMRAMLVSLAKEAERRAAQPLQDQPQQRGDEEDRQS